MISTRRRYQLACGVLCVAFAAISLSRSLHKPFWRDEVVSMWAAQGTLARAFAIGRGDSSGLLFNPLLHLWLGLAGRNEQLLRVLPLLFALATVLLIQWRAYSWLHPLSWRRSLALAALSLNTVLIFYSAELRNQTLFIFLATLLLISTEQLLSGRTRWLWTLLASAALSIISYPLGIVLVGCVGVVLAAVAIRRGHWRWIAAGALVAVIATLFLSPLLRTMLAHAAELRKGSWLTFDWFRSLPEARGVFAPFDQVTYERRPINALTVLGLALCLLGIWQVRRARAQRGPELWLGLAAAAALLFVLAAYAASFFIAPIFFRRYLSCTCTAFAAMMLLGYSHPIFRRPLVFAGAALIQAVSLLWVFAILLRPVSEFAYQTLAQVDVPIFTDSRFDVLPCIYYSSRCRYVGEPAAIPREIGAYWFAEQIPFVESWSAIREPELALFFRANHRTEPEQALAALGYHRVGPAVAGDQVLLQRWSRRAPPPTDPSDLHK